MVLGLSTEQTPYIVNVCSNKMTKHANTNKAQCAFYTKSIKWSYVISAPASSYAVRIDDTAIGIVLVITGIIRNNLALLANTGY